MQNTRHGLDLSVAILMDDLASAKEIASALRLNHILAHHYQTLEEFWVASSVQAPDIVFVDVTKMSQGRVLFRQHPKVIDHSMSYVFFSKNSTKILLQSTVGLRPFGFVHEDASLNAQILGLIERKAEQMKKQRELQELEVRIQRLQNKSQRIISDRSQAEEFRANFEFVRKLCYDIENDSNRQDFMASLLYKMANWDAIDGFGVFELNQSGQKLISPECNKRKYHPFPSLWLGQANVNGIEKFAQDMALQVANDLFEVEPIMIKIHGGNTSPDIILFISFTQESMASFPWDVFESSLSSSFRRLKLNQQSPQTTAQFLPVWEALDTLDRLSKPGEADMRVVSLSFNSLTHLAQKKLNNKFYWSAFFNDFFLQLSSRLNKSTKLSLLGPWQLLLIIPKENLESEFRMIQTFTKQFGYWKFFEDNSDVLTDDLYPVLKLIPASSAHYLKLFEKEFESLMENDETKRLMGMNRQESKRLSL